MEKRGQIAIEYILMLTLALMIILPAVYLFRNYAYESNENLVEGRMYEIGNTVITSARKLYYYGPPSKTAINLEMPPQVDSMFILVYNGIKPEENEYYLGYQIAGKKEILIDSQVPLNVSPNTDISLYQCKNLEQDCNPPKMCYCFPDKFYSKGKKIYTLEAIDNCYSGSCITIRMD
jgi:hypothetical protein